MGQTGLSEDQGWEELVAYGKVLCEEYFSESVVFANLSSNQKKNISMSVNSLYEVDKYKEIYERSSYNLN